MKTKAIGSIFLLFTIVIGIISIAPDAFADHHEITITPISGSGLDPGCEETEEGCYNPNTVTVYVGSVIIFSNTETTPHTFTSGVPSDDIPGDEFNSSFLSPGDSYEWTPENVGEFPYFDMIHPWMQGLIIVQESKGQAHSEAVVEEAQLLKKQLLKKQLLKKQLLKKQLLKKQLLKKQLLKKL